MLLGRGRVASAVIADGVDPAGDEHRMLRAAAADPDDGPVVADAADGIGIAGIPVHARAAARAVAAQLVAQGADLVEQEGGFHGTGIRIAWSARADLLPAECRIRIDLDAAGIRGPGVIEQAGGFRALAITGEQWERRMSDHHRTGLPHRVDLADLLPGAPASGLGAPIGRDATGPVLVDLIADGPHALVAGTTGSGKSELLVSWVLALAATRTPEELTFLLVDFKGGAAFAPLADVPHVIGILSDLDPRLTRRAIESLRAELLRRERLLADAGARSIDDLPAGGLARLVIVVDEFAALVSTGPALHEVFGDLAARGRSLGLHLILCTQRPAGVVRDAVLANIGLRICLRVTDRGDSLAMTGDDAAARLPADPRGRAVLQHDGGTRVFQVAVSAPDDAARVRTGGAPAGTRPWLDPLLHLIRLPDLPPADGPGRPFGALDLPAQQRQPTAVYDPARHGHLLVLGAAGAGASTALATLCAGGLAELVSPDPADAWAQLAAPPADRPLVIDGLDALLAAAGPELGAELSDRLQVLLRAPSPAVLASARRLAGPLTGIAGLFGSRLLLRQSSRDEHLLAGGASEDWDPAAPPGAGTWRGDAVQVAIGDRPLPAPSPPSLPVVLPGADPVLAIVASRPGELGLGPHLRIVRIGADAAPRLAEERGGRPTVLLGDPDAWQAEWGLLTEVRRSAPIALIGCSAADHRVLLREPTAPPPLGRGPGECWLSRDGRTVRALLQPASTRDSEENRPLNR